MPCFARSLCAARLRPRQTNGVAIKRIVPHNFDCQPRAQLLTMTAVNFSIVTPSFRKSAWLKLGIAAVADPAGVELEHIGQDSCPDAGAGQHLCHRQLPAPNTRHVWFLHRSTFANTGENLNLNAIRD